MPAPMGGRPNRGTRPGAASRMTPGGLKDRATSIRARGAEKVSRLQERAARPGTSTERKARIEKKIGKVQEKTEKRATRKEGVAGRLEKAGERRAQRASNLRTKAGSETSQETRRTKIDKLKMKPGQTAKTRVAQVKERLAKSRENFKQRQAERKARQAARKSAPKPAA